MITVPLDPRRLFIAATTTAGSIASRSTR